MKKLIALLGGTHSNVMNPDCAYNDYCEPDWTCSSGYMDTEFDCNHNVVQTYGCCK